MQRALFPVPAALVLAIAFLASLTKSAIACMVCIPVPETTAADLLIEADVVALARENPEKPFSFRVVETLKGELAGVDIDLFLNSTDRRRLNHAPDRTILLVRGRFAERSTSPIWWRSSAQSTESEWRSLGFLSERRQSLVREILTHTPRWKENPGGLELRVEFFIPYLADREPAIRDLAYLEVGRAPYDLILRADPIVPSDQVHAFLANPQYLEWHPLYILLLGFGADASDRATIRRTIADMARLNQTLNLSAWAAALVEVDGREAIAWLEDAYFASPSRDDDTVLSVIDALSVHGNRPSPNAAHRARIVESYSTALDHHPALAGRVARDLSAWEDWRLADKLAAIDAEDLASDPASSYAIDYYLGMAAANVAN